MNRENYLIYKLLKNEKLIDLYIKLEADIEVEPNLLRFKDEIDELITLGLDERVIDSAIKLNLKKIIGGNKTIGGNKKKT